MIKGTASRTARSVAAHRLDYARLEAPYGDPEADEVLARDVAAGLEPAQGRMHDYLRERTAFFDRVVVNTIDSGDAQVVVGGAGYDGRSLRYARPGTTWFELDHPDTQADKRERLGRLGIDAGHVQFVPADFTTDPIAGPLAAAGLDTRRPALFLLEGVAIYLASDVLERLLVEFRSVTPAGSVLAISGLVLPDGQASARLRESVAAVGEQARLLLPAEEVRGLLARTGWQVTDPGRPGPGRRAPAGLLVARAVPLPSERTSLPPVPHVSSSRQVPPASGADGELPLSALLSKALVAYTIEFDNEFEHRMPHRTTLRRREPGERPGAPWLTSLVMWATCVRHVPDDGITVGGLRRAARTGTNLDGMRRWRYVTLTFPDGRVVGHAGGASGYPRIVPETVLRLTPHGREARQVWAGLDTVIEARWRERFGQDAVGVLRAALGAVAGRLDQGLPDCLPILGYGLFSRPGGEPVADAGAAGDAGGIVAKAEPVADRPLWALLSPVLLAFAAEFEREPGVSLAVSADVLRVLTADGVRSRDVPALAGVSKESVAMGLGLLRKAGLVAEEPDPAGSRAKVLRLTAAGVSARNRYPELAAAIETGWRERFGAEAIGALRRALLDVAGGLRQCLDPYPDGWRASVKPSTVLPHYPMVLHRGGYPDGS